MGQVKTRKEENPFGPTRKRVCVCGYKCAECGKFVGWPSFDSVYDEGKLLCLECYARTGKERPHPVVPGSQEIPFASTKKTAYDHGPQCARCGKATWPYPLFHRGKPYCWECDEKLKL